MDVDGATEYTQLSELDLAFQDLVPIVEIAFKNDMWWSMSAQLSAELLAMDAQNQDAVYCWDWGSNGRTGSWINEGNPTTVNRYKIEFQAQLLRHFL